MAELGGWWLALLLIGVLALPLSGRIFGRLPGLGLAWSKALGLLVVGYSAWLLAMLGFGGFGLGVVALGLAVLAGASGWALRADRELWENIVGRWREWLAWELLFGLLMAAGAWLRVYGQYGAGIYGTEKPMELMIFNAILTSPAFPPQDLWLAGYSVNYYYLGYVLMAVPTVLSGVGVGIAFNLSLATVMGLAGVGAAGLVVDLLRLSDGEVRRWRLGLGAFLAVVLLLVAGNQIGAWQRITGTSVINRLDDSGRLSALWQGVRGQRPPQLAPEDLVPYSSDPVVSTTLPPMAQFDWWPPSRAIYDRTGGEQELIVDGVSVQVPQTFEVITEFPFFSFYLGDMHPHVLALPWAILVIALALSVAVGAWPTWPRSGRGGWLLAALAIGALYGINSWDAPTYGALYAGALLISWRRAHPSPVRAAWLTYAKALGLLVLAALVLYTPFLLTFTSFAGRDSVPPPFDTIPVVRTIGRIIGPALAHTSLTSLVAIFGLFAVPLGAWLWGQAPVRARLIELGLVVGIGLAGLLLGAPAVGLAPLAWLVLRAAWRRADDPARALVLLLAGLAALLVFVVDIIYLRDNFDKRFNTVFKVYYQCWLLLALAAAYASVRLLRAERRRLLLAWAPLAALLLVGALVYPYTVINPATTPRWDVPRTLDGLSHSAQFSPDAQVVARWLAENSPADARIVTFPGSSYGPGGEIGALSGRAALLAWPGAHQSLWRSKQPEALASLDQRTQDIAAIYTTQDPTALADLLTAHQASYVIWGPNEMSNYPQPGIFETTLSLVFEHNGWRIYTRS